MSDSSAQAHHLRAKSSISELPSESRTSHVRTWSDVGDLPSDSLLPSQPSYFRPLWTEKATSAQEFREPWQLEGRWFRDSYGRTMMPRGANVSGITKLPTSPPGDTHIFPADFFEHRSVSFIGRPFSLEEAPIHFLRLKAWGMTLIRLVLPWEAIEHAGPGLYDEEYLDYIIQLLSFAEPLGFRIFIDPHQDVWSRYSGGSGAPGWTFEVCGMNVRAFKDTGAAFVQNTNPVGYTDFIWPTNYGKLASATMFTLFWGGKTFAPHLKMPNGESSQEFLQSCYCKCYAHVATRLKGLKCVIGMESMNEPHQGYIGMRDLTILRDDEYLLCRDTPSPLQSFALGDGIPQVVPIYDRSWPYPTKKVARREVNPQCTRVWFDGVPCVWRQHGVWDVKYSPKTGLPEPYLKQPDYFYRDKDGNPYDYNQDFMRPFFILFAKAIHEAVPHFLIFVEGLPVEKPPTLLYIEDEEETVRKERQVIADIAQVIKETSPTLSVATAITGSNDSIASNTSDVHSLSLTSQARLSSSSEHGLLGSSSSMQQSQQASTYENKEERAIVAAGETMSLLSPPSPPLTHKRRSLSDAYALNISRSLKAQHDRYRHRQCVVPQLVYAPHWYDLKTVFDKYFSEMVSFNVLRIKDSNMGLLDLLKNMHLGASGARFNILDQVSRVVRFGHECVGEVPIIIGETGIPFNMNHGEAYKTGDYYRQIRALDAILTACEKNLVGYTLWNYSPINDHRYGDHWNFEDFSFYSPVDKLSSQVVRCLDKSVKYLSFKQQRLVQDIKDGKFVMNMAAGSSSDAPIARDKVGHVVTEGMDVDITVLERLIAHEVLNAGGRALEAVVRPFGAKIMGVPVKMTFERITKTFKLHFDCEGKQCAPGVYTEIFVPHVQYRHGIAVVVSDGAYQYDPSRQTLYYEHDLEKCSSSNCLDGSKKMGSRRNISSTSSNDDDAANEESGAYDASHVHTVVIKPTIL